MKSFKAYLILFAACIMICSSKESIGQQIRFDGTTLSTLMLIPDSLKTPEQKELRIKLHRVYHTNIKFRGDSIAFLLDKAGFLSEGLTEAAYLEFMEYVRQFNNAVRESKPHIQQKLLSTEATFHAAYLNFFGYEYSDDTPILVYTNCAKPGELPVLCHMGNDIMLFAPSLNIESVSADTLKVVPK